jgi:hypothetical protein
VIVFVVHVEERESIAPPPSSIQAFFVPYACYGMGRADWESRGRASHSVRAVSVGRKTSPGNTDCHGKKPLSTLFPGFIQCQRDCDGRHVKIDRRKKTKTPFVTIRKGLLVRSIDRITTATY